MIRKTFLIAGLGAVFLASTAFGSQWDKKTNITLNESILIPGKVLPPGKYVMKLLDSSTNRNIVQIFDEDQKHLEATVLAINNYRVEPTDKTVISLWETPVGAPPALRAWFYPGDNYGQEFAYPRKLADQLSASNQGARVPVYDPAATGGTEVGVNPEAVNPAVNPEVAAAPETVKPEVAQVAEPETVSSSSAGDSGAAAPAEEPVLLAQNSPPPAPVSENALPAGNSTLPSTASRVPLIAFGGLGLFGIAMLLRRARRRRRFLL